MTEAPDPPPFPPASGTPWRTAWRRRPTWSFSGTRPCGTTVRTAGTPGPAIGRIMAITQAAVYDSVNALDRTHEVYLVDALAHPKASREAAVAAAAHRAAVLYRPLYPAQAAALDAKLTASLATIPDGKAEDDGVALGRSVADQILALRQNDGSGVVLPPYLGSTEPGQWRPTPPANLPGLLPGLADVTPFAMTSNDQFRPAAPPALDSAAYTAAFNEVKELGSATSATRTADQADIARFWANGAGTAAANGHLNLLAQIVAQQQGNTLEENARLFAALNIAMADAVISCWDAKYEFSFWRPVTGIREAANDGNPDTAADAGWTPLLVTPNFPAYTSGHSTVSGAAAAVLADFFGTDNVAFTLPSQNPAIAARSYTSFSQAAEESAVSRLYGGIHWSFDNNVGLTAGTAVGEYVVANFLRPVEREAAAGVVNGELIVVGTDGGDLLHVVRAGTALVVWANGERLGQFDGGRHRHRRGRPRRQRPDPARAADRHRRRDLRRGRERPHHGRAAATTASSARTAATCSWATPATTVSTAAPATTSCSAASATTCCSAAWATTGSSAVPAWTSSTAAPATTACSRGDRFEMTTTKRPVGPYRQASPHRPGTAPALGLRRGDGRRHSIADQPAKGRTDHVIPQLAAEPPIRPGAGPGPTPSPATGLASSRDASAKPRSPGRPPHAQLQPGRRLRRRLRVPWPW